jgi:hypothetical protein
MAAAREKFMGYGEFSYSKKLYPLLNFWFTFEPIWTCQTEVTTILVQANFGQIFKSLPHVNPSWAMEINDTVINYNHYL